MNASVLFTDLGANQSYTFPSRFVLGTSEGGGNAPAYDFTASMSGSVSQIDIALDIVSGGVVAELFTAAIGCGTGSSSTECSEPVPTTLLGSWTLPAPINDIATVTGVTGVTLISGNSYYLQLVPKTMTTIAYWADNLTGAAGYLYQCNDHEFGMCVGYGTFDYGTLGAFDLLSSSTTIISEPATVLIFGSALGGLSLIRRRKERARPG